ncbi:MAG: ribosomal-processing cysteine protease Prp [bacterium]
MVIVTITRSEEGKIVQFEGLGHADFAKSGEDIVCAAVSALLQSTIRGLKEYVKIKLDINKKKGYLKVRIREIKQESIQLLTDAVLETLVLGLKAIEKEYKKYMKLIERREKK